MKILAISVFIFNFSIQVRSFVDATICLLSLFMFLQSAFFFFVELLIMIRHSRLSDKWTKCYSIGLRT